MLRSIAIRKENKDLTEQRSPLSPNQIGSLVKDHNINVILEPGDNRFFSDKQYIEVGANISTDLSSANIIFGVKEIPIPNLPENKACCFFSHTIKGQSYNMPLLKAILEKKITLLDYEKVTDETGRRLIFFGPFAGLAGAINAIWLLGQRLNFEKISNPFSVLKQANTYKSLDEIKSVIKTIAMDIQKNGLPQTGKPWTIAITGGGTVSKGAQEIIDLLPVLEVSPQQFRTLQKSRSFDLNKIYKVVIDCDNFVKPVNPNLTFDWTDYFDHPEKYKADFKDYLPDISVLINGIYWNEKYPKLVTKQNLADLFSEDPKPNLRIIADITCDIEGSIECNLKSTSSSNPAYVYNPFTEEIEDGTAGTGTVILAVDKLPSELPGEATEFFGEQLKPFVAGLAQTDWTKPFEDLKVALEFKRAVIAHQGKLTPDFEYLSEFL